MFRNLLIDNCIAIFYAAVRRQSERYNTAYNKKQGSDCHITISVFSMHLHFTLQNVNYFHILTCKIGEC